MVLSVANNTCLQIPLEKMSVLVKLFSSLICVIVSSSLGYAFYHNLVSRNTWILKGSDDGVQYPELLGSFGLCPSSGVLKKQ
jgi:hypothetical protein